MKQEKIHKYITGALLLYFALFVIPPVSSFNVSSGAFTPAAAGGISFEQDHRQTRLYLVDICIWLKLNESRHSVAKAIAPVDQAAAERPAVSFDSLTALQPDQAEHRVRFTRTFRHAISGHLSRTSDIYFARSGIAPPYLA
jgi:hypothetical protein